MTNKEICLKYQEIEEKAIKIAKERGQYDWLQTNVEILKDGLNVVFVDGIKDEWITEQLVTWEDLND
jgi:hypothetical protein